MNTRKVSNFNLDYGASNQQRIYAFNYENFENDVLKNQIFYELEVQFMDNMYGNNCVFEINRKQININNKVPNSKIEQIAETAAQAFFPIKIKIKKNGEIDSILNHDAIKERWPVSKNKILEYYKGQKVAKVISKIENILLNEILLQESLNHNWFFHLFFKPLYVDYTEKLSAKYIWKSPVFGNQFIEYGVVQTVQEKYSTDDKITINVVGISIEERTIEEIRAGYNIPKSQFLELEPDFAESDMNVDYKLYEEDRSIYSVRGTFNTKISEKINQKIQLEIYHLTESSSFRPQSDTVAKENQRIFESWQAVDKRKGNHDYFFDLSKEIRENPPPHKPVYTGEKIELFVEEILPKKKKSMWNIIKLIFRKNK